MRCRYAVHYGNEYRSKIAKFSNYRDAMAFARIVSNSEVTEKTGLIGQFVNGKPTPEFAHLDG